MARRAIGEAHDARELRHDDDLLRLGGEFGFSRASQHYLAGSTLLEVTGAERDAIAELEHASPQVPDQSRGPGRSCIRVLQRTSRAPAAGSRSPAGASMPEGLTGMVS